MKKTCENCIHFSGCLVDNSSERHIHNFCHMWKLVLENPPKSLLTRLLEEFQYDTERMLKSKKTLLNPPLFDDIECGIASCYMFSPITEESHDAEMEERFNSSRDILLDTFDFILTSKMITDTYTLELVGLSPEMAKYIAELDCEVRSLVFK